MLNKTCKRMKVARKMWLPFLFFKWIYFSSNIVSQAAKAYSRNSAYSKPYAINLLLYGGIRISEYESSGFI